MSFKTILPGRNYITYEGSLSGRFSNYRPQQIVYADASAPEGRIFAETVTDRQGYRYIGGNPPSLNELNNVETSKTYLIQAFESFNFGISGYGAIQNQWYTIPAVSVGVTMRAYFGFDDKILETNIANCINPSDALVNAQGIGLIQIIRFSPLNPNVLQLWVSDGSRQDFTTFEPGSSYLVQSNSPIAYRITVPRKPGEDKNYLLTENKRFLASRKIPAVSALNIRI